MNILAVGIPASTQYRVKGFRRFVPQRARARFRQVTLVG